MLSSRSTPTQSTPSVYLRAYVEKGRRRPFSQDCEETGKRSAFPLTSFPHATAFVLESNLAQ